jgi:NAD-dependent deacetylase
VSAASGIPTFRGAGGLWRNFRAEDLATPEAFARDPLLSWQWYDWRRGLIAQAQPNAAHLAIAKLEQQKGAGFTLVTQNVDGLHARAGSRQPLEIHGDLWTLRCTRCHRSWKNYDTPLDPLPPECPHCGGLARPGVVWFGEGLPEEVWERAVTAVEKADVLLVVGTSAVVFPAASLIPFARESGAKVIEVNLESTAMSRVVDVALQGPADELVPLLVGGLVDGLVE